MKKLLARFDERGMTTAEYAVGTVASVSLVGVIISILSNDQFRELLFTLIKALFGFIGQWIQVPTV
ncbi:MAG: DUF4244 domain-containing protein [Propionibacteriaceae bacterium]|jgi:Flp pilus assembly pilin Flp|nr:DUF4244 domain-containing protein [Propionibacteriaceae bacterium]